MSLRVYSAFHTHHTVKYSTVTRRKTVCEKCELTEGNKLQMELGQVLSVWKHNGITMTAESKGSDRGNLGIVVYVVYEQSAAYTR